ncbi:MAG: hypothetical protein WCS96_01260 [Victivallales bacterium]
MTQNTADPSYGKRNIVGYPIPLTGTRWNKKHQKLLDKERATLGETAQCRAQYSPQ